MREARRALVSAAYDLQRLFDDARLGVVAEPTPERQGNAPSPIAPSSSEMTLREAYEAYLSDPSRRASPKSNLAYRTVGDIVMELICPDTPLSAITRTVCRDLMVSLSKMPRNAKKRWPSLTAQEAIHRGAAIGLPVVSVANANGHLNKFCAMLNWAVREELLSKNPAVGLRLPDPVQAKDKRLPFHVEQLRKIFAAPLFTGCVDDNNGYAKVGPFRPRRARFWVPLIGLFSGARLNEICQLDTRDVRMIDGIWCFIITSDGGPVVSDKRLKTASSDRVVPIHPILLDLGFGSYLEAQKVRGSSKLFPELRLRHGLYSHEFSRWFGRFMRSCGAAEPRTCYHSFRHNFADALRKAKVDRDVALALGGWTGRNDTSVADRYGTGHSVARLLEAISMIEYDGVSLDHLRP